MQGPRCWTCSPGLFALWPQHVVALQCAHAKGPQRCSSSHGVTAFTEQPCGGFLSHGGSPKWMVFVRENRDLGVPPHLWNRPCVLLSRPRSLWFASCSDCQSCSVKVKFENPGPVVHSLLVMLLHLPLAFWKRRTGTSTLLLLQPFCLTRIHRHLCTLSKLMIWNYD